MEAPPRADNMIRFFTAFHKDDRLGAINCAFGLSSPEYLVAK